MKNYNAFETENEKSPSRKKPIARCTNVWKTEKQKSDHHNSDAQSVGELRVNEWSHPFPIKN